MNGSVKSDGAGTVEAAALLICQSTIGGGVTAVNSVNNVLIGDNNDAECLFNTIHGSVKADRNKGQVGLGGNQIDGVVTLTKNTGEEIDLDRNTIRGTLSCSGNTGELVVHPNCVTGTISGQCAGLGSSAQEQQHRPTNSHQACLALEV